MGRTQCCDTGRNRGSNVMEYQAKERLLRARQRTFLDFGYCVERRRERNSVVRLLILPTLHTPTYISSTAYSTTYTSGTWIGACIMLRPYLMACDAHAPLFWDSEPSPTFAQTPLPSNSTATLS